ncbi:MAG: hypothetical protein ABR549_11265 [Mycobacteriales bacterium]
MTHTVLPAAPYARRTALAGLSVALSLTGALVDSIDRGESLTDIWPPILVASCLPPALGILLHGRRVQRWLCLAGAFVTGLVALVLIPYGYGIYQLPAVIALAVAAGRGR